jgi:hypothetical protein
VLVAGALSLCSCGGASLTSPTPKPTGVVSPGLVTQATCTQSHFEAYNGGFPEVQGIINSPNQFWALLFASEPLPTGQDIKIVWRMTGSGPLMLAAYGPAGMRVAPDWGPEVHGGSTWSTHPGDEWGAGFTFPRPGCWEVVAKRGSLAGQIGLPVV